MAAATVEEDRCWQRAFEVSQQRSVSVVGCVRARARELMDDGYSRCGRSPTTRWARMPARAAGSSSPKT
jgi:hypothetical protein